VVIEVTLAAVTLLGDPQTQDQRESNQEGARPHIRENKKEGGGDSSDSSDSSDSREFQGLQGFQGSGADIFRSICDVRYAH